MKISIITPYLPGLSSGSAVRSLHLLKNLTKSNNVTLLSGDTRNNPKELKEFKLNIHKNTYLFTFPTIQLRNRIHFYLQNKIPYVERLKKSSIQNVLKFIPKDTDIIQIAELQAYSIVEPFFDTLLGKKILDAHNIDYLRIKSEFDSSPLLRKIAGYPIYRNLKKYEIEAIKKVDYVLTCSEIDKKIYEEYIPAKKIKVIPNGVDIKAFHGSVGPVRKHSVLFMGLLSYSPNEYGIRWYIDYVHPEILKHVPDYRLMITGKNAPVWLVEKSLTDPSIELLGFVDNIQKVISSAEVCICPIFSGSGTRLKLLEYMAMGKAIVATTQGAEGIDICAGKEMLIADTTEEYIEGIIRLFEKKSLREKLQKNAVKLIKEKYTWDIIGKTLNDFYKTL